MQHILLPHWFSFNECNRHTRLHPQPNVSTLLSDLLDSSEIRWVEEFCCSTERKVSTELKEKHDKKLSRLLGSKLSEHSDSDLKKRWFKNLSSKKLTELERDLNMASSLLLLLTEFQLPKSSPQLKKEFFI